MSDPGPTVPELEALLRARFGHAGFREGQLEALTAVLAGRDVVAVMPTGGGKSLLYQLPALLRGGATLVVSPLIALMKDQVDALEARGIAATFINSTLSPGEQDARVERARRGEIKLLYLAPERFRNERFRTAARGLEVALLAIDEAHCISEWGHDFRPDYRRLGEALELLGRPPVIALTATATPEVRHDIVRELGLKDPFTLVSGFDRKNLHLAVVETHSDDAKREEAERTIDEAGGSGIIYVASRKSGEKVAEWLGRARRKAGLYHAGLDDAERARVQDAFMSGELPIIVATNAFGMGIDKADIRFVVHWEFPKSLEAYYQEVGRAGRDGKPARALLLFSYPDKRIQDFFIESANPDAERVRQVYTAALRRARGGEPFGTQDLQIDLGLRNDMGLSAALSILERAGVVEREARAAGQGRARNIRVTRQIDPGALPIDAAALNRKLQYDRQKLDGVLQFAWARSCRKERLLGYFGDARKGFRCGACDRCAGPEGEVRPLSEEEADAVRAVLALVQTLNGRLGRMKLAQLLVGKGGEVAERYAIEEHPSVGALRQLGQAGVLDWIETLLGSGHLEKEDIGHESAYVLRLGAAGRKALRPGEGLLLAPPRERRAAPARSRARRGAQPPAPASLDASAPGEAGALAALKRWRREAAHKRAVPAYVVFHDATLEAIVKARPRSLDELQQVAGVGTRKLEEYGEIVLDLLRQPR